MKKVFFLLVPFLASSLFGMVSIESNEAAFLTCEIDTIGNRTIRWCMLPPVGQLTHAQLEEVKDLTKNALEKDNKIALNEIRRRFPDISFLFIWSTVSFECKRGTNTSRIELNIGEGKNPLPSWNEYPENIYKDREIANKQELNRLTEEPKTAQNGFLQVFDHYVNSGSGIYCVIQ